MSEFEYRFGGIGRLYGVKSLERLKNSHVCIIGIGGVGTWIAESLTRSGIGKITLVDMDDICITNVNRQIHALDGNIGKQKINAMADRMKLINPEIEVNLIDDFFTAKTAESILGMGFDFVVDAIDSMDNKCLLAALCTEKGLPLLVVGGAGGKQDPTRIKIDDLSKSYNDKLLQRMRKKLRRDHGFPKDKKKSFKIDCVFSYERAVFPNSEGEVCHKREEGTPTKMDCASGFGAITHITGSIGFFACAQVIKRLLEKPL